MGKLGSKRGKWVNMKVKLVSKRVMLENRMVKWVSMREK